MGRKVNEFVAESFVNHIGQTINPGDDVVAMVIGSGRAAVRAGKFEGVYRSPKGDVAGTRVGSIAVKYNKQVFNDNGAHEHSTYMYNDEFRRYVWTKTGKRYDLVPTVEYTKSCLQRNRVYKLDPRA